MFAPASFDSFYTFADVVIRSSRTTRGVRFVPCVDGTLLARTFWLVSQSWSVAPMCPAFLLGANTDGLHAIRKISSRSKARAQGPWDERVLLIPVVDRLLHDLPFALANLVKRHPV
jgi:hypothetical protein